MNAQQEAGAIIAHYLRQLTQASGRRWTAQNDHDMQRLGALLADDQAETIAPYYQPPELPAEPARQIGSAVTQVLERRAPATAEDDPAFQRWRNEQRQAEVDQTRRLVQREARR